MTKQKKPFVGSYSKFKNMATCPLKFYHMDYIRDVPYGPMGAAAKEGDRVHAWLAKALTRGLDLPPSLKYAQWALDLARTHITYKNPETYEGPQQHIIVERKLGLNGKLQPTGFFDDDVKFRAIADLCVEDADAGTAFVADWKNGKYRPDMEQLADMALVTFIHHPKVHTVTGQILHLKHPEELGDIEVFERSYMKSLAKDLIARFNEVKVRKENFDWPPKKSGLCKAWCDVPHSLCEHSGKAG